MTVYHEHVEMTCQRCEGPNPTWSTDSDRWNVACEALGLEKEVILCPTCFIFGHQLATRMKTCWTLQPGTPFVPFEFIMSDKGSLDIPQETESQMFEGKTGTFSHFWLTEDFMILSSRALTVHEKGLIVNTYRHKNVLAGSFISEDWKTEVFYEIILDGKTTVYPKED